MAVCMPADVLLCREDAEHSLNQMAKRVFATVDSLREKLGQHRPSSAKGFMRSFYPGLKDELLELGVSEVTAEAAQVAVDRGYSGAFEYHVKNALANEVFGPKIPGFLMGASLQPGDWVVTCSHFNPCDKRREYGMVVMCRGRMDAYLAPVLERATHHRDSAQLDYRGQWVVRVAAPSPAPQLTIPDLPDGEAYDEVYHPDFTPTARRARRSQGRSAHQGRFDLAGSTDVMVPQEVAVQMLFFEHIHDTLDSVDGIFARYESLVDDTPKLTNDERLYRLLMQLTPSELTAELVRRNQITQRFLWASGLDSLEARREAKGRKGLSSPT